MVLGMLAQDLFDSQIAWGQTHPKGHPNVSTIGLGSSPRPMDHSCARANFGEVLALGQHLGGDPGQEKDWAGLWRWQGRAGTDLRAVWEAGVSSK